MVGYASVSINGQEGSGYSLNEQKMRLQAAGCVRIYADTASGVRTHREGLIKLLARLHRGDTLVVVKLDRLARSLLDLLTIIERIGKCGAGFRSLTENIDTTTPAGVMIMHVIGAIAQFERELIKERTKVGIDAAKRAGRKLGRRFKLSEADRKQIVHLVREGKMTLSDCARTYHIHRSNIGRLIERAP